MAGLPGGSPASTDARSTHPAPPVYVPPQPRTREDNRRTVRARLLRFIIENHRRRQVDASRGLRVNGAD